MMGQVVRKDQGEREGAGEGRYCRNFPQWNDTSHFVILRVPDWPLAALTVEVPPGGAAAVVHDEQVKVVTQMAHARGVRVGMPQIIAQCFCPGLVVFPEDEERDNGAFEVVLEACEEVTDGIIALHPGLAIAPVPASSPWHGREEELRQKLEARVALRTGVECWGESVGVDSPGFSGSLAARMLRDLEVESMSPPRRKSVVTVEVKVHPPALTSAHTAPFIHRAARAVAVRARQAGMSVSFLHVLLERGGGQIHERIWASVQVTSADHVGARIAWQARGMTHLRHDESSTLAQHSLRQIRVSAWCPQPFSAIR